MHSTSTTGTLSLAGIGIKRVASAHPCACDRVDCSGEVVYILSCCGAKQLLDWQLTGFFGKQHAESAPQHKRGHSLWERPHPRSASAACVRFMIYKMEGRVDWEGAFIRRWSYPMMFSPVVAIRGLSPNRCCFVRTHNSTAEINMLVDSTVGPQIGPSWCPLAHKVRMYSFHAPTCSMINW